MLDKFHIFDSLFQKKVVKSPGLLSIYVGVGFVTFAYTNQRSDHPIIQILERIAVESDDLSGALTAFMSEHQLSHVQCVVTLNPADYRLIYLDAPNVTDEELGGAAKWLVKEFINFPLSNAAVDAFRVPVRAGQPSKMYAVVAQIDRLKSIISACEKATMDVIAIDIAELSLRNLMKLLQSEMKEVGLLFMRSDFHAVLISHEDTLCFSRNIEAKIPADLSDPASKEEGIQHLVKEIERSIYFYQSNIGSKTLEKIWISTELEDEASFLKIFSESSTLSCETFDFHRFFTAEKKVKLSSVVYSGIALGGLLRQE